ncbi:MAG: alpha-L-fucosidase [Aestuariibaculum sp.]
MGQTLNKTQEQIRLDKKMKWWKDARFGMFIHWGVGATFGGEYKGVDYGKEMGDASCEWLYLTSNILKSDYEKAALKFNPTAFNVENWVKTAKAAGMKYMVLTAKHHDGFAMFGTKTNKWNVVEASSYKKDIVKQFIDECHKQDMRVGIYYSHEKDWVNSKRIRHNTNAITNNYSELVKKQLTEILTNYGTIDLFWFDMGVNHHKAFNTMCYNLVKKYQPNCIINSRLGNNLGDYSILDDREIASPGNQGYVESIMTMRLNWGYDNNDRNWKSSKDIIAMLSKTACRNSNFLLNVGPQPNGSLTPEELVRLEAVSKWMTLNSESIYGTDGSPFSNEYRWGSITSKNNKLYLHLFHWNGTSKIKLSGIANTIISASILSNGEVLAFNQNDEITINLPSNKLTETVPVIVLELDGTLKVDMDKAPVWQPEKIHHVTRKSIKGIVKNIENTTFTIFNDTKNITFKLNETVEYRIIKGEDIHLTQGFNLKEGEEYEIIYSPFEIPRVEMVILKMKD